MKEITIIAAIGKDFELGIDNRLIWHINEDLQYFKKMTMNKPIVMGMNTFKSLPGMLTGRLHIILTSKNIDNQDNLLVVHSMNELLELIDKLNQEVMIIGGANVYSQMISYADKMLLTEIDKNSEASVYFPKFNSDEWDRFVESEHNQGDINYKHVVYIRKKIK